jgi:hypothetical protein
VGTAPTTSSPDDELVVAPVPAVLDEQHELEAVGDHLGFSVPLRRRWGEDELHLLSTLTHFGTAVDVTLAELRLEAFLPADEASAAVLRRRMRS